jgi:hypothetical protein
MGIAGQASIVIAAPAIALCRYPMLMKPHFRQTYEMTLPRCIRA